MTDARATAPVRLFVASEEDPRSRRATDVIALTTALAGLVLLTLAESPQPGFIRAIGDVLLGLPDLLDGLWQVLADVLVLFAVVVVGACVVRRRWSITRDVVLAAVVAVAVASVVTRVLDGSWPALGEALRRTSPPATYPARRLAIPAAVVIAVGPHLTLPFRRLGRWMVAAASVATVALGATTVLGVLAGLLVAVAAASAVLLMFGSSDGRPSLDHVRAELAELGVQVGELHVADEQQSGVFLVRAPEQGLDVKVYGRDAHGAVIVSTAWRALWLREPGSPAGLGRRQQVTHEAFLTLLAERSGVLTDAVVAAGATVVDDALLVLRRSGRRLADLDPPAAAEAVDQVWSVVAALHGAGIAHGQIDDHHLILHEGRLGLRDFRAAAMAPTPLQLRTDRVQALVTACQLVGPEQALASAVAALGAEGVADVLPLVQMPTLTDVQRRQVRATSLDLDDLRSRAAEAAGVEEPKQQQLRRFTFGSIFRVALPVIALFALVAALSGLDFEALGAEFGNATVWLLVLGFVVSQLPRIAQALSTLGASPVPLPLGPTYALQLSVSYVNLAVPSSAARMAINIRFFQRHGVPPGGALAAGALDGFSGFLMQLLLLGTFLVVTPLSLDLDLDPPGVGSAARFALMAVLVGCAAIGVVLAVRRLRQFVVGWVKQLLSEAAEVLRGLRSPRRLALLFGGNLASEVLFALALGTFARAFGFPIGLGELLLIGIAVSLLAGLLPIPGGIGVAEGGLIFGLVAAGVPEEAAFAIVIMYRLATFYLPPIWGFLALRWLTRNQHL